MWLPSEEPVLFPASPGGCVRLCACTSEERDSWVLGRFAWVAGWVGGKLSAQELQAEPREEASREATPGQSSKSKQGRKRVAFSGAGLALATSQGMLDDRVQVWCN